MSDKLAYECAFCSLDADPMYEPTAPGPICRHCAELVANAFWKAHSGRYLTIDEPQAATAPRKAKIPADVRRQVYERDKYRCVGCGTHLDLTLDHIAPESLGGPTVESNLQTLCRPCNSHKGVRA